GHVRHRLRDDRWWPRHRHPGRALPGVPGSLHRAGVRAGLGPGHAAVPDRPRGRGAGPALVPAHGGGAVIRRLLARGGPYAGFAVFALVFGLPVYWILLSVFLPPGQLLSDPPTYFTTDPTLDNIQRTAEQIPLWTYFRNSAIFAVGSSALTVALAFFAAYAFARLRFRGSNLVLLVLLLTMALPQLAATIPLFKLYNQLGLVDTKYGLILLQASLMIPLT